MPPCKRGRTKARPTSTVDDEDVETGLAAANTTVDDVATMAEATTEVAWTTSNAAKQTGMSAMVGEGTQSVVSGKPKRL